ncbi:hypothetical protein GQ54DRAFT_208231 [Martensiomyces pterosporus]|nr:hypothetical protein GQ54DRAFT_208231 [Martensiomyces pterosporus]
MFQKARFLVRDLALLLLLFWLVLPYYLNFPSVYLACDLVLPLFCSSNTPEHWQFQRQRSLNQCMSSSVEHAPGHTRSRWRLDKTHSQPLPSQYSYNPACMNTCVFASCCLTMSFSFYSLSTAIYAHTHSA